MATDPAGEISELSSKLASVEAVLDPEAMREEADVLRKRAGEPGLWEDQEQAQAVTRRLSYLDGELSRLDGLHRRLDDTKVLFELAESESDAATREEATRDLAALRKEIDQLEIRTLLAGEYDAREALITINAQAGSADAAGCAGGLRRIYLRRGARRRRGALGRGLAPDLPALGRAARVLDRDLRHLLRGRVGDQVDHVRGKGAVCLRHAARRARHAPECADLEVRQPGPQADLVRGR